MTDPSTPGAKTSEFAATIAGIVTVAGAVIAGAAVTFDQLKAAFPETAWLVPVAAFLSVAVTATGTVMKFIGSRTDIKVGMLGVEAAKATAGMLPAQAAQPAQPVGTVFADPSKPSGNP